MPHPAYFFLQSIAVFLIIKRKGEFTMKYLLIEYPKCTTCQKAKKWLNEHKIEFTDRHIVEQRPKEEELKAWIALSGLPIKKFFNTSGMLYKEMNLKEKLPRMSQEEQIRLLASNGMLVKRPLLISDASVLVGFRPDAWETQCR